MVRRLLLLAHENHMTGVVESVENQNSDVLAAHLHCLHVVAYWYVVVVVLVHWLFVQMCFERVVVYADAQHDLDGLEVVVAVVRDSVSGFAFLVLYQNFVGTKGYFQPALTAVQMPVVTAHSWLIRTVEFHPVGYNVNLEQLFLPVNNIAVYAQVTVLDHEAVLFEELILGVEVVAALEMAVLIVMEVGAPEIAVHEIVVLEVAALILALEVVVPDHEVASFVVAVFYFDMVLRQGVAEMVA